MKGILHKTFAFPGDVTDVLAAFRDEPYVFLLESSQQGTTDGRYSFVGFDPYQVVRANGKDALAKLKKACARYSQEAALFASDTGAGRREDGDHKDRRRDLPPLINGAVGCISYDHGLAQEGILVGRKSGLAIPDICFGLYDCILAVDHLTGRIHVTSSGFPEKKGVAREKRAVARLEYILKKLERHWNLSSARGRRSVDPVLFSHAVPQGKLGKEPGGGVYRESYLQAVQKALAYIAQGDIYQVNLSRRFELDLPGPVPETLATAIYGALRQVSPSRYGGYFDAGDFQIISSSPERFLRVRGRNVQTRPMKGTRPRGTDIRRDAALKRELELSGKDKAELLMITDLERSDLGRVCEFGSVRVTRRRVIETYRTVFQATSTIEGVLRKDKDAYDLLQASFPGGSITGCPKIRAMQIIDELEPVRRGLYTGCLGYMDFGGAMDFNILIRTIVAHQGRLYYQTGSGIVADSIPEKEYEEVLVKAWAIRLCLEQVFGGREKPRRMGAKA